MAVRVYNSIRVCFLIRLFVTAYILLYDIAKRFNTYSLCALLSSILSCQVIFCPVCGRFLDISIAFFA